MLSFVRLDGIWTINRNADYIKPKKDKKTGISYYDLNKNGHLDIYENPAFAVEERVRALLSQMTLEEKVGQMLTSLGWPMYERQGNTIRLTEQLVREIEEYHTGSLWGFMRADPWTQRTLTTGLTPALAAKASNMLQKYAIEHGRFRNSPVFGRKSVRMDTWLSEQLYFRRLLGRLVPGT